VLRFFIIVISMCITVAPHAYSWPLAAHPHYSTDYWLWAGIAPQQVPAAPSVYVYQGLIVGNGRTQSYQRIGIYPHPLPAQGIYLTYRLEGKLPSPSAVVAIFNTAAAQWQRHGVLVRGLQLDFDSPTGQLLNYSAFLQQVRGALPAPYRLSITGLGDWLHDKQTPQVQALLHHADEIIFQLYQGWNPLPNMYFYIDKLAQYPLPFKVGLLSRYANNNYLARLQKNSNFNGVVYFIQK
jgi:Protein of unknown function (DUF3142)